MYGATILNLVGNDTDMQADTRINTLITCLLHIIIAILCREL